MRKALAQSGLVALVVTPVTYGLGGRSGMSVGIVFALLVLIAAHTSGLGREIVADSPFVSILAVALGLASGISAPLLRHPHLGLALSYSLFFLAWSSAKEFAKFYAILVAIDEMADELDREEERRQLRALGRNSAAIAAVFGSVLGLGLVGLVPPVTALYHWITSLLPDVTLPELVTTVLDALRRAQESLREFIELDAPLPRYSSLSEFIRLGLPFAAGLGLAMGGAQIIALTLATQARRAMIDMGGAFAYVKVMLWPAVAFALGFFGIVIWFAAMYASLFRVDDAAFSGAATSNFWDFLYFSLLSIAGLDASGLQAVSPLAKTFVAIEVVAGIGWIVVVFAGVIAYVEPRFRVLHQMRQPDPVEAAQVKAIADLREAVHQLKAELIVRQSVRPWQLFRILRNRSQTKGSGVVLGTVSAPQLLSAAMQVVVSVPRWRGAIERVSYEPEDDRIRLVLNVPANTYPLSREDIIISEDPVLPTVSRKTIARMRRRPAMPATRFVVSLPCKNGPTRVRYELARRALHFMVDGCVEAVDQKDVQLLVFFDDRTD